jgi:hypothetical protein
MRLLDTTTKILSKFQGEMPAYAILYFLWEKEEVTFRDIVKLKKGRKMGGYAKIVGACGTAVKDGCKYIWIDTCCINKESSAELSEAISMVQNARICYAYP